MIDELPVPVTASRRVSMNPSFPEQNNNRRNSSPKVGDINLEHLTTELREKEREINVTTALRLIREVAKTRSKSNLEDRKKRATYSIADEPQLILHNVETMKKDAQAAYFYKLRNTKDNGLIPAARPKLLRPISANLVSEIMISEEKRLEEEAEKAALKHARLKLRRDLQQEAWVLGSPSPLTFPSSPSFNDLILDTIPISSRNTTLAPKIYESNTAVDKGKKMNDGEDSTSTVSGEQKPSRRGTKKEFKPIPCQRKPSRRDTTKSLKLKDVQSQEENRRRSLLEEKRKQHVVPFTDTRLRQNFWVLAFTNIARLRVMTHFVDEFRLKAAASAWQKREKRAVWVIERFWLKYRFVLTIKKHPRLASKVRIFLLIAWRKRKIAKKTAARNLVYQFLKDISGVSDRTQKVYRYRARVVRLQRYLRSYLQCQHARILLLWLAFQKLMAKQRLIRNREIHTTERNAVRNMKRSKFFGPTVQKLDEVYTSLSTLMHQRNQVYKSLIQKQKHIEHLNTSGVHSPTNQKSSHQSGFHGSHSSSYRNQLLHRAGGGKFMSLLLSVLHNQRRRHVLVHDSESGKNQSKTLERQAVDDADVKEFLLTPNHPGPTYVWNTISDSSSKKFDLFLLLTGGGLRELDSLAYNLVLAEDNERKGGSSPGGRSLNDLSSNASGRDLMEYLDGEDD